MRHTLFTSPRFRGLTCLLCLFVLFTTSWMLSHHQSHSQEPSQGHSQNGISQSLHGATAVNYIKEHDLYDQLQTSIKASRYELDRAPQAAPSQTLKPVSNVYLADNPSQHLRARFSSKQFTIEPTQEAAARNWQAGLKLKSYGYGARMIAAKAEGMHAEGSRVEIKHSAIVEWYINTQEGIEQGFTLAEGLARLSGRSRYAWRWW